MAKKKGDKIPFDKKYIKTKLGVIQVLLGLVGIAIAATMFKTMVFEREHWIGVRKSFELDSVDLKPMRGNILSTNGELMASSLPNYKVHFDFIACVPNKPKEGAKPKEIQEYDSLMRERKALIEDNIDTLARGLAEICPALDVEGYRKHLKDGLDGEKRYYDICPGYILNYIQFNRLMELPVFKSKVVRRKDNEIVFRSGIVAEERNNRKKPFGSLATKVLGNMYGAKDSAIYGLELAYDSLLRGEMGMMHQRRIRSKNVEIVDREPENGYDLISTIDISLQDACESALRAKLQELNAEFGVVILLETKTGDVKAMVNLERDSTDASSYREIRDWAMGAAMEPGSTFKTASIMVALDDGEISMNNTVDTGGGVYKMYGRFMRDSGWATYGGHGVIDVTHAMIYSSNVGVSRLIDSHYHNKPEKFVEGLKRVGIGADLGLSLQGVRKPMILGPSENKLWAAPSIPWMSIGYGTLIPPISTVTFYNAIANNGRMVRPRFARGYSRNGEIVEEFPVEVVKEQICKPQTLKDIQSILKQVVNDTRGTGKKARSKYFSVSGKTGTAQVAVNGSYAGGMHFVTFCGFFPSDAPQYTCLVSIETRAGGASGGGCCGPVFAQIADRVYSKVVTANIALARDSVSTLTPMVKNGNMTAAKKVLEQLSYNFVGAGGNNAFGQAETKDDNISFAPAPKYADDIMPDLTGMGARDAVFVLEHRGMHAVIHGSGRVKSQSLPAGAKIVKGKSVVLTMN